MRMTKFYNEFLYTEYIFVLDPQLHDGSSTNSDVRDDTLYNSSSLTKSVHPCTFQLRGTTRNT